MEIVVSGYQEVAGPLGGLSVEYIIDVNTSCQAFKICSQRDAASVSFTVSKTFKELEYFYKKLKAKHPSLSLPNIAVPNSPYAENKNERQKLANKLMKFIASEPVLWASPVLLGFLDRKPPQKPLDPPETSGDSNGDIFEKVITTETSSFKPKSENMFTNDSEDEENEDIFKELKHQKVVGSDSASLFCETTVSRQPKTGDAPLFEPQDLGEAIGRHRNDDFYVPLGDSTAVGEDQSRLRSKHEENSKELLQIDSTLSDIFGELELHSSSKSKPSLLPKPCPVPSPRPAKPSVRPVPPPRTTLPSTAGASASPGPRPQVPVRSKSTPAAQRTAPATGDNQLATMDILNYIQCEEDAQKDNVDLFWIQEGFAIFSVPGTVSNKRVPTALVYQDWYHDELTKKYLNEPIRKKFVFA